MSIKGGTLPPSTPGPFSPGDAGWPSPENSRQNEAAQLALMANSETAKAVAYYESQMASWNYSARIRPDIPVAWPKPQVPRKRVVVDGQVVLSTAPACEEIPAYEPPKPNPPGTPQVGPAMVPGWFSVLEGDTVPFGQKISYSLSPGMPPVTLQKVPGNLGGQKGWYMVVPA